MTVTVPAAGKVTLVASVKGRKVASGKATAKKAGTVTVKLSKVRKSLTRQDPHPQVDLQSADHDEVAEGALAAGSGRTGVIAAGKPVNAISTVRQAVRPNAWR